MFVHLLTCEKCHLPDRAKTVKILAGDYCADLCNSCARKGDEYFKTLSEYRDVLNALKEFNVAHALLLGPSPDEQRSRDSFDALIAAKEKFDQQVEIWLGLSERAKDENVE